ncbi:sn-glycerol-3-phosphate transport system permease protein UgpA [Lentilactobacillus hilgardii]|uniref:carbohydrate ABC transporter permease n=1 Tax=Lentilactobacillus hilgardii TaxID=1588 RepID=UPI00019C4AF6|nr:sugar ABC transporter permease [Lentilactobacillus hilgardii]EEI20985.1 ABC transporter, permease protein [Lentilactobacillus buchneri ATCC 11577]MCT3395158.1 sugar ABC transporter permease [Lentilactobacillus hilgardii]QIR08105.1 sn-glycerol-3-phosphate transport system permease protein UgpA [Lentilactobacillus hilgardii]
MLKSPATHSSTAPVAADHTKSKAEKSEAGFWLNAKDKYYAWIFLGPSLLILSVFIFYPMFRTLYLSLFLTNTVGKPTVFVGLSNYINLLTSTDYLSSLWVTMVYVLAVTAITIVLGLVLANYASKQLAGIGIFRTLFSATMGVSVSVAAIFWLFIFNPSTGFLSLVSTWLHLPQINWLTDPIWAMLAVIITTVWMNLGFTFLILLGAMQSVPTTLYEAASIEGATPRYQLFHITIPMISPTLFFVSIITLIEGFKSFGLIDLMTKGGPTNATNMLVYRIYKDAFYSGNYAQASAESLILTVIIAIFTLIQFKVLEKRVNY